MIKIFRTKYTKQIKKMTVRYLISLFAKHMIRKKENTIIVA